MAVVAQKFMMKKDVERDTKTAMPRASTQHDNMFGSILEGTTNDSVNENSKLVTSMHKTVGSMWDADAFKLPSILDCNRKANTSPFKGFLDISIVNQQLKKTLPDAADFDIGKDIPF
jgi:hypothetical protein